MPAATEAVIPATLPVVVVPTPASAIPSATAPAPSSGPIGPVATSDLGKVGKVPGLAPKPKPFIAGPPGIVAAGARPSTLLLEHASADSPVPITEYAKQPVYSVSNFHLRSDLSASEVERKLGPPAQIADNDDPWLVYRISSDREIWLHFTGPLQDHLDAADVIRGAEDGYVRTRVFSAEDTR